MKLKAAAVSLLEEFRPSLLFPKGSSTTFPPRLNRFGVPKIDGRYIRYEHYQLLAERASKMQREQQLEIDRLRSRLEIALDRGPC